MPDLTTLLQNFLTQLYNGTWSAPSGLGFTEQTPPAAAPDTARVFSKDVSGTTVLMVQLPTGPAQRIATGGTLANAADTNYVFTTPYTLPAGTLATNSDQLLLEWTIVFSAAVSTKTYQIAIGHSAAVPATGFTGGTLTLSSATAAASATLICSVWLTRINATTGNYMATARWANATTVQGNNYAAGTLTWANALTVQAGAKDGTGNAAAVTIAEFRVTYRPV